MYKQTATTSRSRHLRKRAVNNDVLPVTVCNTMKIMKLLFTAHLSIALTGWKASHRMNTGCKNHCKFFFLLLYKKKFKSLIYKPSPFHIMMFLFLYLHCFNFKNCILSLGFKGIWDPTTHLFVWVEELRWLDMVIGFYARPRFKTHQLKTCLKRKKSPGKNSLNVRLCLQTQFR